MQSANRLVAETQITHIFVPLHPTVCFRFIVEFLDLQRCERRQLDVPDARLDMLVNVVLVICRRGCSNGRLRVVLVPELRPLAYRVISAFCHIDLFEFFHRFLQLLFAFSLCSGEDVLRNRFSRLRIDARCVAPLPAAVLAFADVAFPICPFFRHLGSPFRFGNTNNYHRKAIKSSKFLKISDIFQRFVFQ